ncbi:MAG TPA: CocE/NonD family hydrolase [Cyanobium sp.]|nr:CocE/NonD family hydrolase [Cyanobium sp.]
MPCPDGIHLATRLWRPQGTGPWPVLLMRQPYGRALASTITYAHPSWYAAHGFLVAVQDVRGRGESEGSFGGFAQEAADGAVAVRWARRLQGSDGRVGTYGFSYQGLSQLLSGGEEEADPDPASFPDCLAPAMCGLDERLHWAAEGGAHWWALGLGWALQLAAEGCRHRGDEEGWRRIRSSLEAGGFLREGLGLLERLDPEGMGLAWLRRDPSRPAGWRSHAVAAALLRRPMLLIGGWHDPHLRGVLDLWRRARQAGGDPELRIGAWTHLDWQGGVDEVQLAFFRRHLGPAGCTAPPPGAADENPIQLQCGTTCRWHDVPAEGEAPTGQRWGLRSGGLAAIRRDEGELGEGEGSGQLTFVHDPWRPVPGRGGHLDTTPGPVERGDLDGRPEVACFTGTPLGEPLRLLGEPLLTLVVEADQPGFDLCIALSRVSADGTGVRQLATGVARFLGEGCLEPMERQVRLQPLFASLDPGERLRLSVAAAAWPQIAVNPGDGTLPRGGSGPRHRAISLTLHLKGSRLLLLPLLPSGLPLPPGAD